MKALLILSVSIFCGFSSQSKSASIFNSNFDLQISLSSQTHLVDDTVKAKQLLDEATKLIDEALYSTALEMLDTAQMIYERMNADLPYAEVFHQKGRYFFRKGNYDMAVKNYEMAIKIGQKIPRSERLVAFAYGNLAMVYQETGDLDRAMECYQKSMDIWLTMIGAKYRPFILSLVNLGNVYDREGSYAVAEGLYLRALDMILKIPGMEPERVVASLTNVGNFCYLKGDYKRAIECHQRALEIRLKNLQPGHNGIAVSYNNLANALEATGDTERAKEYHQKAMLIRLKTLHHNHPHLASSYNNLGNVYLSTGDYPKALECHQKALEIKLHTLDSSHTLVAQSIKNLGSIYSSKGDYERAIEYQQRALAIRLKTLGPVHPFVATSYHDLGMVYFIKGDFQQAIVYFQKALETESAHPEKALYASSLFEVYAKLRQFSKGEPYIRQAFKAIRYSGPSSFPQAEAMPILIHALAAKGNFYFDWYATSKTKAHLREAHQAFSEAEEAIAWQRQHLENPGSKSVLAKGAHGVYEGAISSSFLLHQLTDSLHYWHEAFDFAEKSKSLLLYEAMREADALRFAGIPGNLLQQEYDLRVNITYFEKKRQEKRSEGMSETDTTVLALSGKLFDLNRAFEQLKKRFETDYPDYYRLKYHLGVVAVEDVQQLLRPEQTLVEYFTGDSSVFIFVVGKKACEVFEIKKDFPLEEWVSRFRQSVVDNYSTGASEYVEVAYRLYEKLIQPIRAKLTQELIVVPGGVLGYLPFEALLTEQPQKAIRFKDHPYLLRDYRISYCHSATLLREMLQKQHRHPLPPQGQSRLVLRKCPKKSSSLTEIGESCNTKCLIFWPGFPTPGVGKASGTSCRTF